MDTFVKLASTAKHEIAFLSSFIDLSFTWRLLPSSFSQLKKLLSNIHCLLRTARWMHTNDGRFTCKLHLRLHKISHTFPVILNNCGNSPQPCSRVVVDVHFYGKANCWWDAQPEVRQVSRDPCFLLQGEPVPKSALPLGCKLQLHWGFAISNSRYYSEFKQKDDNSQSPDCLAHGWYSINILFVDGS